MECRIIIWIICIVNNYGAFANKQDQVAYLRENLLTPKLKDVYRKAEPTLQRFHPYIASVMVWGMHACTGAVVSSRHVVTAARCFLKANDSKIIKVRIGSTDVSKGGDVYEIQKIVIAKDFISKDIAPESAENRTFYDLAILETKIPIELKTGEVEKIDIAALKKGARGGPYFQPGRFFMVAWARPYESLIYDEIKELELVKINGTLYFAICSLFYVNEMIPTYQRPCFAPCYMEDSSHYRSDTGRRFVRDCQRYVAALGGLIVDSKTKKLVGISSWGLTVGGESGRSFPVMFTLLEQSLFKQMMACIAQDVECEENDLISF